VPHIFTADAGSFHRFTHYQGAEFAGWDILQAAAESSDCRAYAAKYYNFSYHNVLLNVA
jgi:hypothetical protein